MSEEASLGGTAAADALAPPGTASAPTAAPSHDAGSPIGAARAGAKPRGLVAAARALRPAAGAAAAGLAYTLACPPHDMPVLAWLVPGLFLAPLAGARPGRAFACGLLFAMVMGFGVTGWAYDTSRAYFGLGPLAAAGFVAVVWLAFGGVQFGLLGTAYAVLAPRTPLVARGLLGAWLWAAAEVLRGRLFTGMPWELVGHTQHAWLALVQIADLGGVHAVSFVIALASVSVAEAVAAREHRPLRLGATLAVPALAVLLALRYGDGALARHAREAATADGLSVAVVQGNVASRLGWQRAQAERTLVRYAELTRRALAERPDLVVWPEYAAGLYIDREPLLRSRIGAIAATAPDGLILGAPRLAGAAEARNAAYLLDDEGAIVGVYDKRRLVPVAETTPFGLGAPPTAKEPAFTPGDGPQILDAPSTRIGATICYEAVFPHLVRDLVLAGAEILVNLTNESWLDSADGAAPQQHFSMAVFRAIETRRALARAASTGVSGFVAPTGEVLQTIPRGTAGVAVQRLARATGITPYVRWGEAWLVPAGLVVLGCVLLGGRRGAR